MPNPPKGQPLGPVRPGPGGGSRSDQLARNGANQPGFPSSAASATQLARSVANGQRYLIALRADQAAERAARQDGRYHLPRATQHYLNELRRPLSPAWLAQHSQTTATVRPEATALEKLQAHVMATNSSEIGLMMRIDPVTRATAGAVVVVGATVGVVEGAPVAYEAGEVALERGIAHGATMLEGEGLNLAAQFRAVGIRSFFLKGGVNAVGQFAGNYLIERDAHSSLMKINLLSVAASGCNLPLGYNSLLSAGFSLTPDRKIKTVLTGKISGYEFGRDAIFNYGFGKVAAGFKLPGPAGRNWIGLDKLHQSGSASQGVGFATYQAMLRLGPRAGYGFGVALSTGLEHGNKVAVGAAKKYISSKVKHQFPDPSKNK